MAYVYYQISASFQTTKKKFTCKYVLERSIYSTRVYMRSGILLNLCMEASEQEHKKHGDSALTFK